MKQVFYFSLCTLLFLSCQKKEASQTTLTLYPNPAFSTVSVRVSSSETGTINVSIPGTDISKSEYTNQFNETMDISKLKNGGYTIEVYFNGKLSNYRYLYKQ